MMWCGSVAIHLPHDGSLGAGRCNGVRDPHRVNRWHEPSGPEMMERGDRVIVRSGSTSGVVIGVNFRRSEGRIVAVTFVMDRPELFVQTRHPYELDVVKKVVH